MAKLAQRRKQSQRQKQEKQKTKRSRGNVTEIAPGVSEDLDHTPHVVRPLKARNDKQRAFLNNLERCTLTIGTGSAGTGKTYLAARIAAQRLLAKDIQHIVLSRPAVEVAGEKLGFLPGELEEKYSPWIEPFKAGLLAELTPGQINYFLKSGKIIAKPLGLIRGLTFDNAMVLLDECQNTTPGQIQAMLTRLGDNSSIVLTGDLKQQDLKGPSGLADAIRLFGQHGCVGVTEFESKDVVRSPFVRMVLETYEANASA